MAIFTKQRFREIAESKSGYRGLSDSITESRKFSQETSRTSIFLSHAHNDKSEVAQAKVFFENLGISIYVDWADKTMPESTNEVTATRIKHKISTLDKFVLVATNNAVASKWCNWEVGIGDIFKLKKDKICLLPLADNNITWKGSEYLKLYPRIEEKDSKYFIVYPNGEIKHLTIWLNQ